jgi:NitT/TauT family transport system substrate-binding protein
VSVSNPDATAALLGGAHEVNSHFSWPPFSYYELKNPAIHEVLNTNSVLGKTTLDVIWTTAAFRAKNPRLYAAFISAMAEATDIVNGDRKAAAAFYKKASNERASVDELVEMMSDIEYTQVPQNSMKLASFMYRTGSIKVAPKSWKDLFFPEAHGLPGS